MKYTTIGQLKFTLRTIFPAKGLFIAYIIIRILMIPLFLGLSLVLAEFANIAIGVSVVPFIYPIVIGVTILICISLLGWTGSVLATIIMTKATNILREKLLATAYTRNFAKIQKKHTAEFMMLTTEDTRNVVSFPTYVCSMLVVDVLTGITALLFMFFLNWHVALTLSLFIPLGSFLLALFAKSMEKIHKRYLESEEKVRLSIQEAYTGMLLLKAYGMLHSILRNLQPIFRHREKIAKKNAQVASAQGSLNHLLNSSLPFIVYGIGAVFVMRGNLTIGVLIAFANLVSHVQQPFQNIHTYIDGYTRSKAAAGRILEVLDMPPATIHVDTPIGDVASLKVENVRFAYDDNVEILKGVSMEVKPGEVVGIIGESGSGKSTLTKLIMGFYEPTSGLISVTDQKGATTQDVLAYVGYVPAGNFVFKGTIAENICMTSEVDIKRLECAAKSAGIYEFITNLGYDTIIGEGAIAVSSGQGQRIGIARALYKDSPILIFDEPTSNLDADAINIFLSTIRHIASDKICIVVTHDLNTKNFCDRVFSLKNGLLDQGNMISSNNYHH